MVEKARWLELEAFGHVESIVRKQRKMNVGVHLAFFFAFSSCVPHPGVSMPTFRVGLSTSGN